MSGKKNIPTTEELIRRAVDLLNSGKSEESQSLLLELPELPRVSYLLALIEGRRGETRSALSRLEALLQKEPEYLFAIALKAELEQISQSKQNVQEPIQHQEARIERLDLPLDQRQNISSHEPMSIETVDERPEDYVDNALICLQQNQFNEAERSLDRASQIDPSIRDLHYTRAILSLQKNNRAHGRQMLEKELELHPDHQGARELLAEIKKTPEEAQ